MQAPQTLTLPKQGPETQHLTEENSLKTIKEKEWNINDGSHF